MRRDTEIIGVASVIDGDTLEIEPDQAVELSLMIEQWWEWLTSRPAEVCYQVEGLRSFLGPNLCPALVGFAMRMAIVFGTIVALFVVAIILDQQVESGHTSTVV